ncbi:MAG: SHD1 domain-containing protein [Kiritimatiellia bacterium]
MNRRIWILGGLLLQTAVRIPAEIRTWEAVGGYQTEAAFVSFDAGRVTLKKTDGQLVVVPIERLIPTDRMQVIDLAGQQARGEAPAGQIQKPTGRRELTWIPLENGEVWPPDMPEQVKTALLGLERSWSHAESEYFILHYQQVGFAKQVARMADFQYQFIAADLPGFKDLQNRKSHIVVVRNQEEWRTFLRNARNAPEWSAAYVQGMVMYLQDTGNSTQNANILAHEMSHLVLNRFFRMRPPVWLNEGLAEWYGNVGHSAFKGKKLDVEKGLGKLRDPYPVEELTAMTTYPADPADISRFYNTSQQLVGMLMLRKDPAAFVEFLQAITVQGLSFERPLAEVYEIQDLVTLQNLFDAFLE